MKISTFALSIKKNNFTNQGEKDKQRIVKGYFLSISNSENRDFRLRIEFTLTQISSPPEHSNFDEKVILACDLGGQVTYLPLNQSPTNKNKYSSYFTIPATETVSIELLPELTNNLLSYNGDLEASGFVSLLLPANLNFLTYRVESQTQTPIEFGLHPEIRSAIVQADVAVKSPAHLDFNEVVARLETADKKPCIYLEPEPGYPLFFQPDIIANISLP
ncbi:MAG: hypothetical protein WA865_16850 [Spirulinaceae cyanobacterium]